jgi:ubiquinone/menaquinone biosynthesis C-methylase UbiE
VGGRGFEAGARPDYGDFRDFDILSLVKREPVYTFREFYEIRNALIRFDDRHDYVNYGYWRRGRSTENPSAELVLHLAEKLALGPGDVLLNAGSGMGQPDIDIVDTFAVRKIIGLNVSARQVRYANRRFAMLGLQDRIEHRVIDVREMKERLKDEGVTAVLCLEAIQEFPDLQAFLDDCYELLPPGGRIAFCTDARVAATGVGPICRVAGALLLKLTESLQSDFWRHGDAYFEGLQNAGFTNIGHERIGHAVFPDAAWHAVQRYGQFKNGSVSPLLKNLIYLNIRALAVLYAWKRIDYHVFWAKKPSVA